MNSPKNHIPRQAGPGSLATTNVPRDGLVPRQDRARSGIAALGACLTAAICIGGTSTLGQDAGTTPAKEAVSPETVRALIERLDRLEKQAATDAAAAQAEKDRTQRLLNKIAELENKLNALENGHSLPEIAAATEQAPTVEQLDQKIRILERKNELASEAAEAKSKETPRVSVGANGFVLSSADTNFVLRVKGLAQLDSRTFINDNPLLQGNDGFVLRRARPILEGTLYRDFDFNLTPDFAGSSPQIFDAWLNYKLKPSLQLRTGKFKGPVGFENLQSDATLPFDERSFVSTLVPNRSLGVQLWGELGEGTASYAAGVFDGSGDGRNPGSSNIGDDLEFAGRIGFEPFRHSAIDAIRGIGLGVGASYGQVHSNLTSLPSLTGGTLAGYTTPGQQQFFAYNPTTPAVVADGDHWRVSPYAYYLRGPFGISGEYGISQQGVLNNSSLRRADLAQTAWEVTGQWVLTGEAASFTGIVPRSPFDPLGGKWGAWQAVARFSQFEVDDATFPRFSAPATSARGATSWSVGLNWWLSRNVRFLTSFTHTVFDGGGGFNPLDGTTLVPPATVTRQDEDLVLTRLQIAF